MPQTAASIIESVREQYDVFPYPPFGMICQEDGDRNLLPSFNVDLNLEADRALARGAKVWVPGCGTRWAVMLALQFHDVHIVATDLSDKTLLRQEQLARSLKVPNIEFRNENLLNAKYKREFDFISCVGVLHHLPNPFDGFRILSDALRIGGTIELMVYDELNRRYSKRIREILKTFDPEGLMDAERRLQLALQLLRSLNEHASAPRELKRILKYVDLEPDFENELADVVSHPQEHYFDVPRLVDALSGAGLRVRMWRPPYKFDAKFMVNDKELWSQIDAMEPQRSAHIAQLLGASRLELFAEHATNAASLPKQPVRDRKVRLNLTSLLHQISENAEIIDTKPQPNLVRKNGSLWFDGGQRRPAVLAYGVDLDCIKPAQRQLVKITDLDLRMPLADEHIEAIVSSAADNQTIDDIITAVRANKSFTAASNPELEKLCDRLCRTPFRILVTV
jgi:SAM-dependent methyltransferase